MEMVKYNININDLSNGTFTLIPLGDIQYDGSDKSTALTLLKNTIKQGIEEKAYFLGMGDYTDFLSPSNRKRLRGAELYDTAGDVIERTGEKLIEEVFDLLRPTAGRWIGMLEGHHFQEFADGSTSDMRLAKLLRTRHLGSSAYIGLSFNRGKSRLLVNLWATHGCGNGQNPGAPLTKLNGIISSFEADVYLMGHMTKMAHAPTPRLYPSWGGKEPDVHHRDLHLVGTGGYSRAYQVGAKTGQVPRGSYVEQGMMKPVVLGSPIIRIKPFRINAGSIDTLSRQIRVEI